MEVYFDNAATSYPKPEAVYRAIDEFMRKIGTSSGRGAYKRALEADRILYETRVALARLFNIKDASRLIFTSNVTESLNLALKGYLERGDHVITSSLEHNALWRPLKCLEKEKEVKISQILCSPQGILDPHKVVEAIRPNTKLIAMLHASNVVGTLMPIKEVGKIVREKGITFLVDAAQTAGIYPIDVEKAHIGLLAFTGHKGLIGPMGTGGLYIREGIELKPLKEGGTGGDSILETQPPYLPDKFEAGTLNVPGIAGLGAGVRFILEETMERIGKKEEELIDHLISSLKSLPRITIYGPCNSQKQVGVVSINIEGKDPSEVGFVLDNSYGIMVRTGLHCAPLAHRTIGTLARGTLRVSLGYFNNKGEIDYFVECLKKIIG